MLTITTNTGKTIECDSIVQGREYPVLHIHTHAISGAEAWAIFSDPNETRRMVRREDSDERTLINYSRLYSVQVSPFVPGDILIWLNMESTQDIGGD